MNELWMRIVNGWLETYDAIGVLQNSLIEDEEAWELRCNLLDYIMETFRSEVEN